MKCQEAIETARDRAKRDGFPYTVWRTGDLFGIAPEKSGQPFRGPQQPVRPVATYDPDGTEYA